MANNARGEAVITLGGQDFTCVATMGALARVEARTGQTLPEVLEALTRGSYSASLAILQETATERADEMADLVAGPVELAEAAAKVFEAAGLLTPAKGKPGK